MTGIFGDYAYGPGPRAGCWWDNTCDIPDSPTLSDDRTADVAIIGAGFTGLNAALVLAEAGASVIVVDAEQPGFGASGRNGGFCCLGGGIADDAWLDARFGKEARLEWRRAEVDAVGHVDALVRRFGWDVDRHSNGETLLAHKPNRLDAEGISENYGVEPQILSKDALPEAGLGKRFHGALTIPIGFGLNPRKYLAALLDATRTAGAEVFGNTHVRIDGTRLVAPSGSVKADRIIVATNGYSREDVPGWLASRFMPAQSNVIVTRPLTDAECAAEDWTSDQMCYDTRNLLHYFRLLPDRRFLFGMRGGLLSGPKAEARARHAIQRDFAQLFPAWRNVPIQSGWSGFVALARNRLPFVGAVPGQSQLLAALCFHGNGVAMGSYAGHLIGRVALENSADGVPEAIRVPLKRFPLGRWRRLLMPPLYMGMAVADRF